MGLEIVDYVIIAAYLIIIVIIGVVLERKASSGIDSFFLGSRSIPWWALAASGIASNIDISGTSINSAMIYALGVKGFYVEFRGGVTLALAFYLVFGKWNRRANVMTMAEWMKFRFGEDLDGQVARITAAVTNILATVIQVTYFAIGSGKFMEQFLGLQGSYIGISGQFWSALVVTGLAMIYTVTSGLQGVVWTDVFQGVLIFVAVIITFVISILNANVPDVLDISMPLANSTATRQFYQTYSYSWKSWSNPIPSWDLGIPEESAYSIYNLILLVAVFYFLKAVVDGTGGPTGYTAQRYFAAKSDKACGDMTLLWIVLLSFRWMFIGSIVLLALTYNSSVSRIFDPEMILSTVVDHYMPTGIKGFLCAGLIAAGMSTFDSTINAGAAYWVKDLYQPYINPSATEKKLIWQSRISSVLIVVVGLALMLVIRDINEVWGFFTMCIVGALSGPYMWRWFWWRVNAWGFTAGTIAGLVTSMTTKFVLRNMPEWVNFFSALLASSVVLVIVSLATKATSEEVLCRFYKFTRPPGVWGRVRGLVISSESRRLIDKENKRDLLIAYLVAWPFQVTLFMLWLVVMFHNWIATIVVSILFVIFTTILIFGWFRHLDDPNTQRLKKILNYEDDEGGDEMTALDEESMRMVSIKTKVGTDELRRSGSSNGTPPSSPIATTTTNGYTEVPTSE